MRSRFTVCQSETGGAHQSRKLIKATRWTPAGGGGPLDPASDWLQGVSRSYPEPSVELHHHVSEVDPLAAADKAANLRTAVRPDVVAHKVPVDAVFPPFLFVEQDVRG